MNKKQLEPEHTPKIDVDELQAYTSALEDKIIKLIKKNAKMKVEMFSLEEENKRLFKIIKDSGGDPMSNAQKRADAWEQVHDNIQNTDTPTP